LKRDHRQLTVVGFPESGKTTFIAAMYHLIQQPDHSALTLMKLPPNSAYLDEIASNWRSALRMPHTNLRTHENIILELRDREHGIEFELALPDMSGEEFNRQWEQRAWSNEYGNVLSKSTGLLLFISSNVVPSMTIEQFDHIKDDHPEGDYPDESPPYSARNAPTALKLVELLQFARQALPGNCLRHVGVIISAWDLIDDLPEAQRTLPAKWLQDTLPLLHQFLRANDDWIESKVFGVSAQGFNLEGNPLTEQEREEKLRPYDSAVSRIRVVTDGPPAHDITLPIRWAVGI